MGISEFQEIEDLFSKNGVSQIYVKELSKKIPINNISIKKINSFLLVGC